MNRPLIIFINYSSGLNGSELSFFDIVRTVDRNRYMHEVILPGPGPLADKINAIGIPVTYLQQHAWRWFYPGPIGALKFMLTLPVIFRSFVQYRNYFKKQKPALVYLNINRIFEPLIAAKSCHIPVAVHFRDIPSRMQHKFVLGKRKYFSVMNDADVWVANSHSTRQDIQDWTNKNIYVVYNAIDIEGFVLSVVKAPVIRKPDGKKVVAMIGTFTPWKNQRDFIELADLVHRRYPNIVFWLIGEGALRKALETLVNTRGLSKVVFFTGFIDNIGPVLKQVDVLVHTMAGESFGRVFVEAMLSCVPVVAYRSGGASEIIRDGENGFLVDDFDIGQLYLKTESVLLYPEKHRALVLDAFVEAKTKYSVDRLQTELNDLYERILKNESVTAL